MPCTGGPAREEAIPSINCESRYSCSRAIIIICIVLVHKEYRNMSALQTFNPFKMTARPRRCSRQTTFAALDHARHRMFTILWNKNS